MNDFFEKSKICNSEIRFEQSKYQKCLYAFNKLQCKQTKSSICEVEKEKKVELYEKVNGIVFE